MLPLHRTHHEKIRLMAIIESDPIYTVIVRDPDGNEAHCEVPLSLHTATAFQISEKGIVVRVAHSGKIIREGIKPYAPTLIKGEDLKLLKTI